MEVLFPPLKRNVSVSVELTLDLDYNDVNSKYGYEAKEENNSV